LPSFPAFFALANNCRDVLLLLVALCFVAAILLRIMPLCISVTVVDVARAAGMSPVAFTPLAYKRLWNLIGVVGEIGQIVPVAALWMAMAAQHPALQHRQDR